MPPVVMLAPAPLVLVAFTPPAPPAPLVAAPAPLEVLTALVAAPVAPAPLGPVVVLVPPEPRTLMPSSGERPPQVAAERTTKATAKKVRARTGSSTA